MREQDRPPPRLPMAIIRVVVSDDARGESIVGDLTEEWEARGSALPALQWLWFFWIALALALELLAARLISRVRTPSLASMLGLELDQTIADVRLAIRHLVRQPLFAAVAISSLAIGIGANTAIFSVVNRLFLRPLDGMTNPELVVELGSTQEGSGFDSFSYPELMELRGQESTFAHVSAWYPEEMSFAPDDQVGGEHLLSFFVSANYFSALGVVPDQGRFFVPEEDEGVGIHPVVVVSHRFWQRVLGGDPDAIGTSLRLNREPYTIVGVAPQDFGSHVVGLSPSVWLPMMQSRELIGTGRVDEWNSRWASAIARLTPTTSPAQADAVVRSVFRRLQEAHPESNEARGARVLPLGPVPGGGRAFARTFFFALAGLVSLVLLVTCANLAGMVLARSAGRKKEIAMRIALGASRTRLIRYLGTESLVLFIAGGGLGVLLAHWGLSQIDFSTLPIPFPFDPDLSVDGRVLAFAMSVTLVTGALFGTLPALQTSRTDVVSTLKEEGSQPGRSGRRLRAVFVGGQLAFSIVLLASAGLFLRSLQEAGELASGFDPEGVHVTTFDLSREGYDDPVAIHLLQAQILEQVRAIPGAQGAALSRDLPLDMSSSGTSAVVDNQDVGDERNRLAIDFNDVSPQYFDVLKIPVLQGRVFNAQDDASSLGVAIVSRTFADRAWPNETPLGRSVTLLMAGRPTLSVVGVVEDVKNTSLTERPKPFVYRSLAQVQAPNVVLTYKQAGPLEPAGPALLEAIRRVDPSIATTQVATATDYTGVGTLPQRIAASLTSGLGLLALFLSGLGIYGTIAFSVAQRTREIAIRMALGARRGEVRLGVVGGALRLALPGVIVGAILVLALGPLLRSLLIGVSPVDTVALAGVVALFTVVILIASVVPARRASRVAPMEALRYD